jgi:putative hydrolase of the HAD superfamily
VPASPFWPTLDVIVDGSVTGLLKPDPRAYAAAARQLDRQPGSIVFLDDLPFHVVGARTAGMIAHQVVLTEPSTAFDAAPAALGLG